MTEQSMVAASSLVQELTTRYAEPSWLQQWREEAWNKFSTDNTLRTEKTDLSKRTWDIGPFPSAVTTESVQEVANLITEADDSAYVHVRDGALVKAHLPQALLDQGVIFTDMHSAVAQHEELVKKYLGTVVSHIESKWTALNAAVWHGGAFLYVPANVRSDASFQFIYEESSAHHGGAPRVLVVGEQGSQFALTELYLTAESHESYVHTVVTEVVAKPLSEITVASVTQYRKGLTHFVTRRSDVQSDAHVNWVSGDVGDGFTLALIESLLNGTGSQSTARALGFGFGRQHMDLTVSMVHKGRHSESEIVLNGALRDKANAIYRSSTHIVQGAIGAGSEQHDRMMMLSDSARADAIPMLLIDENNVQRCGHAASVGKIDPNQVYYLMSRGIPLTDAMRLIVWGHLEPIVKAVPAVPVQTFLSAALDKELTR